MYERRARLSLSLSLGIAAVAGISGCHPAQTGAPAGSSALPAIPSSPSDAPGGPAGSSARPTTQSSPSDAYPTVDIDPTDRVLVAPMNGTQKRKTPIFTLDRSKFTVEATCRGAGSMTIAPQRQSIDFPCDGKMNRVNVATDHKTDQVTLTPHGSVHWTMAVVVTDAFVVGSPTPAK